MIKMMIVIIILNCWVFISQLKVCQVLLSVLLSILPHNYVPSKGPESRWEPQDTTCSQREPKGANERDRESQRESQQEHRVFKYFVRTSPIRLSKFVNHPETWPTRHCPNQGGWGQALVKFRWTLGQVVSCCFQKLMSIWTKTFQK